MTCRTDNKVVATAHDDRATHYGPETPVPIFQHEWEFSRVVDLYNRRVPKNVLEIGSYHGGTLHHWLVNATFGTTVTSVDSYAVGVDNRNRYAEWISKGVWLNAIEGNSHDEGIVESVRRGGPYDWIFIDAGHYYDEVKRDWENYGAMAEAGGVVLFHDILTSHFHPEIEVERLWREIQKLGYVTQEFVADPGAAWGGIGVVYMP